MVSYTFHLIHLLTTRLTLQTTPVRIVAISSDVHANGGFDLEDLNWRRRKYSAFGAYQQSKLCNILFVKELTRRRGCKHSLLGS